jgi:hypothetical protein
MKKIIFGCLLLGSCMAGSGDFQSNGLLLRLLGILESVGSNRFETLTLSGYLKDENGNPIANATMGVENTSSDSKKEALTTSTKTDLDGRYTLTLKVGSFTIRVTDSSGTSLGTFSVQASSTTTDPVISVSAGSFVVTVTALNNGTTSSPSALSYSGSPYTFTKDNAIPIVAPTYSGSITSCKSTPTLPTGLSLSSTCEISGNPTVVQIASSYHIVGSNSFGNASTIIVITVNQLAPSSFGYFNNVVSLTQNIQMASLQTYYTGTITSCSSAPPLPAGLQMDPSSCIVYGTPTSTQSSTSHTITASNSVGSTTANLIITVNLKPPSSLSYSGSPFTFTSGLPISSRIPTYSNSISTCSANPSLPSGLSLSSVCTITGTPSSVQVARSYTITASNSGGSTQTSIVITINPQAPASLSYSGSPFTFTRNVAITTRTPTVTGTISNCTISPALPTGLGINSTTCAISGTPNVTQTATTHTITASNLGGSTTTSITITVNLAAPTSLSYAGSPFTFTQNVVISSQTPTVTGTISTCTISPNLPSGLGINGFTCVISGTPTVVQTASNYTITASNSGGSTTATISIAVNIAPPSSLSYSGSPYTLLLGLSINSQTPSVTGTISTCTSNPTLPSGLSINNSTCVISGTPTALSSATNYIITAGNSAGSTTSTISISVLSPNNYIVSMPTGLLKTGQTTSYVPGDDGTYQKGVSRTFTTGGTSGLIWQRCSIGQNNDATCSGTALASTWADGNSYCSLLKIGARSWRLPNNSEYFNIIEYSNSSPPTIKTTSFPSSQVANGYWVSEIYNQSNSLVWFRSLNSGILFRASFNSSMYIRCIIDSPITTTTLSENNGTISDSKTNLIWQKCLNGQNSTSCSGSAVSSDFITAINYCENLTLANRTDWRLPNIIELSTIIDFSKNTNPTIPNIFTNTPSFAFWSSTTYEQDTRYSWLVNFITGDAGLYFKNQNYYYRCVTRP